MINNKMCKDCDKFVVCQWANTINKFDGEVTKNPIPVEITMDTCPEYKEVADGE